MKKKLNKKTKTKNNCQPQRTKSIERVIQNNQNIIELKLGSTRSQTQNTTITNRITKQKILPISKPILKSKPQSIQKSKKVETKSHLLPKKTNKKNNFKKQIQKIIENPIQQTQQKQNNIVSKSKLKLKEATAGIVDVVFCCDTTHSMKKYLNEIKDVAQVIISNITKQGLTSEISVLFGFVCYRDHPPQSKTYVTKIHDLCDSNEILEFIKQQDVGSGGDIPEAVLDGLYVAAKQISWRESTELPTLRYIFHIGDAPPHGKEFSELKCHWPNGVPTGIDLDQVAHVINCKEIHYRYIQPPNSKNIDKMKQLFKQKFTNYEEIDLKHASQLNIRISDMIIRELCPDIINI